MAITQDGSTVYYNLLRDHLGSITHVVNTSNNSLVTEYSYDSWGRMRDPATWESYDPGTEPVLCIAGRGFTGHEHLPWFNLINMNGRVYDPLTGQFLSPDNYVQEPGFSQSFNRYSYCMNNPLKYTDIDGEWFEWVVLGAFLYFKGAHDNRGSDGNWEWNPLNWFGPGKSGAQLGVSTNSSFTNFTVYGGLVSNDNFNPSIAYNSSRGIGMVNANNPGGNSFYFPSVNYNSSDENAIKSIEGCRTYYADKWNEIGGNQYKFGSGEITKWNKNWIDKWSESPTFLGDISYTFFDGVYVTVQSFIIGPDSKHLTGEGVIGNDRGDAFMNTTAWVVSSYAVKTASANIHVLRYETHYITPLKGRGAGGAMKVTHINIDKIHIIFDVTKWKYYYKWWPKNW